MLVKKQKMSASLSCNVTGVCVSELTLLLHLYQSYKLLPGSENTDTELLTDCSSVQRSVRPPFCLHIDILGEVLKMFMSPGLTAAGAALQPCIVGD